MRLERADFGGDDLDRAHAHGSVGNAFGCGHLERCGRQLATQVHRVRNPVGELERRQVEQGAAVFRHHVAVDQHAGDPQVLQIVQEHDVGALAGRDGAQVVVHLEALRAVDGDHLDGGHRIDPQPDGYPHDVVEMPVGHQRVRVRVIADQRREARVDVVRQHGLGQHRQVLPGRAVAQLGVHAEAHLRQHVLGTRGLVAAAHARGDVGVQAPVGLGHGVMAGHDLARFQRGAHFAVRVVRAS